MPDFAHDRKAIRAKEKQVRIDTAERAAVLRELMSTTQGRAYIWDLLANCQCYSSTFTGEAITSAFNEGRRSIGLTILADILSTCPDQYIQAQRESNERTATSERRSGPQSDRRDSGTEPDQAGGAVTDYDPYGDIDAN